MHEPLSQWGCTSLEAASAAQALELLAAQRAVPDLVLADYRLAGSRFARRSCEPCATIC